MSGLTPGRDREQIVEDFRRVAKGYASLFRAQRDHIHNLLGAKQRYSSGIFREGLLRNFLTNVLPQSVSVDSGFIYGFGQAPNSAQIDILVWDSSRHAAVYRTREFVIIPPEAAIAAIAVKTSFERADIQGGLENLQSLVPLEFAYRGGLDPKGVPLLRPVTKILVSYEGPRNPEDALGTVGNLFEGLFARDRALASRMATVFSSFDPIRPSQKDIYEVERVIPKLLASIETDDVSFMQGWGPPKDVFGDKTYGPRGLRRLPYMYRQENRLTSPLEKVVYYVLASTYATLGTVGWSLVSAWGDFNPVTGFRLGDASEVIEERGVRLLDPDSLAPDGKNESAT